MGQISGGRVALALLALIAAPLTTGCGPQAGAQDGGGQAEVEARSARDWVGKKAKGFALPGLDGQKVDAAKSLGKRPVVLVFYRGVW